jgi:hypothetical protein
MLPSWSVIHRGNVDEKGRKQMTTAYFAVTSYQQHGDHKLYDTLVPLWSTLELRPMTTSRGNEWGDVLGGVWAGLVQWQQKTGHRMLFSRYMNVT